MVLERRAIQRLKVAQTWCFSHFDFEMLRPSVFYTFDFQMCCAPQRHAIFRLQLPKMVRTWLGFSFLTWKCASPHKGVQFFISHLTTWLRTRRFSKPTFDPSEPQIIGKTQWIVTFLPFREPASSFFSLFLSSDLLTSFLLLPDSSHLCFSICPYCRTFDCKLPLKTSWWGLKSNYRYPIDI